MQGEYCVPIFSEENNIDENIWNAIAIVPFSMKEVYDSLNS